MTTVRRVLAEKRRLIYPLVGAVVFNAALFGAVVYPLSLKVANGERDAQAAASARAAAQAEIDAAKATVSGKASADAELQRFYGAVLPPDQSAARRIIYGKIDKLASAAHVTLGAEAFEPSQERGSRLGKLTATVQLMGEYRNIRRFIHDLETAEEFLILENVALSQDQGQGRDLGLNVLVKVSTYFRIGGDAN
jgi:Type II secretion system (T2SS), protein M subtype b